MKNELPTLVTIKGYPTQDGVVIEQNINDMRMSMAEYQIEKIDEMILKTMTDEMLMKLFHQIEGEMKSRKL